MNIDANECIRCGSTAGVEGTLFDASSGGGVSFLPKSKSFLKQIFGGDSRKIYAYACVHCSHLEFIVDFTDKDRKLYQKFDGPQPGVIERIDRSE